MTSQPPDQPDDSPAPELQPSPATSLDPASAIASDQSPDDADDRFPVVGIGASAGGLEAFTELLNHLPIDTGMAFVLVQHLDPNYPSLLSEILARTTQMRVQEVEDGMTIAPNHVYVIPSNTTITIAQGKLNLATREKPHRVKVVDVFFNSLAEDLGSKAIAVVLSGGDDDGTRGLEAIKAAGGITFAQSDDSAQVASMPKMAIATGQVDFILSPEEIAAELTNISRHPYIANPAPILLKEEAPDYRDAISQIFILLQSSFEVDFTQYKRTTIQRRIFRRMALHHLDQLSEYAHYLQQTPPEVQALYEESLIHVTSFFRDGAAFETLKSEVFPMLLRDQRPTDSPIRIWVAGCSTGEEAYSLAICLLEFLAHQPRQPQLQIFATDVSELVIERARLGIYSPSQVSDVSPDRLQRFFDSVEGGYQISKTVRERCVFARQNLLSDPPFSRMDLISCRNVLIYFGAALQKKVLPMFHYGLKPTGFLMLGSSETVGELSHLFHLLDRKHKIYTKLPTSQLPPMELEQSRYPMFPTPSPLLSKTRFSQVNLSDMADQIILNQYAPVGVVVNAQLDIVQFRGQTGAYLEPSPGQASLNVLSMVKEELRPDLQVAIQQVKKIGKPLRKEGIHLISEGQPWKVQLDVVPIQLGTDQDSYFLILFNKTAILPGGAPPENPASGSALAQKQKNWEQAKHVPVEQVQELVRVQQELETTKAYLRSIIEEQQATNQDLRAANEEILSSNEELQSTNEELQTAKEEIQATNEELSTINDELYRRNSETMQVSNDFQNLLSSIQIPILMLEADLRIRRFTPTAATLFNLISTDIGRPLSDIKHNLTIADLEAQILEVINTLHLKAQEVQDQAGHWYDLRIRPYRTLDNRIDGAVVVLVEIDALKRSAYQLQEARDYAEAIAQTIRDSLLVLNADLQVVRANSQFYRTFQVTPSETENTPIYDLGNGQWNIPQLRSLLEDLLPHNTQIADFQVEHNFEHIGQKTMRLNARQMVLNSGDCLILLAIEDISPP